MSERNWLRLRAAIGRWFWVVAIGLAVIALATGWMAYQTHFAPETTTEERVVSSWSTHGSFDHEAVVRNENPVFPVDSTLENRSVYYQSVSPDFTSTYTFSYSTPGEGSATVKSFVELQIRAVSGEGEDRQVHWSMSETLIEREVQEVEPGAPVTVEFDRNATALQNRISNVSQSLGGGPGTIETRFVATTAIEGQIAERRVERTERYVLPISLDSNTYSFGDTGQFTETYDRTEQYAVPRTYGPLRTAGAPVASAFAIVGLLLLGWLRYTGRGELTEAEQSELAFRTHRDEFDDWITTASLPDSVYVGDWARVNSLEDLVDLAIDTDERVIEDPRNDIYVVVDEDVTYRYSPPISIEAFD